MDIDAIRHLVAKRGQSLGLRQVDIARQAGVSREMLYKFGAGKSDLGTRKLIAILSVLGLRLEVVPDLELLPKNHRQRKTRKQRTYLGRRSRESFGGIAHGAKIDVIDIPDLGDGW